MKAAFEITVATTGMIISSSRNAPGFGDRADDLENFNKSLTSVYHPPIK